jgi:hypothetical protein
VKQHERRPREVIVGKEYRQALEVVNATMPLQQQIRYFALDYTKISKSKQKPNAESDPMVGSAVGKEWDLLEKTLGETMSTRDNNDHNNNAYNNSTNNTSNNNTNNITADSRLKLENERTQPGIARIDLFGELDDIAAYSISETAFFCR